MHDRTVTVVSMNEKKYVDAFEIGFSIVKQKSLSSWAQNFQFLFNTAQLF